MPATIPRVGSKLGGAAASGDTARFHLLLARPEHEGREDERDASGETPLTAAADNGHTHMVALLLSMGANASNQSLGTRWTPLHHAAVSGHAAVVDVLARRSIVLRDAQDHRGRTALFLAARWGHVAVVGVLLRAGAFTSVRETTTGETALEVAEKHRHVDVVEVLVEYADAADDTPADEDELPSIMG